MYQWNRGIDTWDILKVLFPIFGVPALAVIAARMLAGALSRGSSAVWGAIVGAGMCVLPAFGNFMLAAVLLGTLPPVVELMVDSPILSTMAWSVIPVACGVGTVLIVRAGGDDAIASE